ncbi:hypothetical protein [Actinobacillus arthritidis]|uniref:hypothetical protein n=1 Tax=Actinobacillus arthritidis TaxID=157339 RepID=UPI002442A104|nr:hypothetical protein [Actinobacillus arthritidis]WGE88961.1 hypothetical protein NYR89_07750 [Actinobacillus arthritidis]
MKNMKKTVLVILSSCAFFMPSFAQAETLKNIMQYALTADPTLDEARANIAKNRKPSKDFGSRAFAGGFVK